MQHSIDHHRNIVPLFIEEVLGYREAELGFQFGCVVCFVPPMETL